MTNELANRFQEQAFANDYALVNGTEMHLQNPEHFHVPPFVLKRHLASGQFVELRIDSPRFSVHAEEAEQCRCPACNGQLNKPIIRHPQPASLAPVPKQMVPSRGWGEDFWVRIQSRQDDWFIGLVDNTLAESRLHGVELGAPLLFHCDHVLAIHPVHRAELLANMDVDELKELAQWLQTQPGFGSEHGPDS